MALGEHPQSEIQRAVEELLGRGFSLLMVERDAHWATLVCPRGGDAACTFDVAYGYPNPGDIAEVISDWPRRNCRHV